jgi:hypothetical protein
VDALWCVLDLFKDLNQPQSHIWFRRARRRPDRSTARSISAPESGNGLWMLGLPKAFSREAFEWFSALSVEKQRPADLL